MKLILNAISHYINGVLLFLFQSDMLWEYIIIVSIEREKSSFIAVYLQLFLQKFYGNVSAVVFYQPYNLYPHDKNLFCCHVIRVAYNSFKQ